jgi:hypothetical protein
VVASVRTTAASFDSREAVAMGRFDVADDALIRFVFAAILLHNELITWSEFGSEIRIAYGDDVGAVILAAVGRARSRAAHPAFAGRQS